MEHAEFHRLSSVTADLAWAVNAELSSRVKSLAWQPAHQVQVFVYRRRPEIANV
jgi:hypothetical protein